MHTMHPADYGKNYDRRVNSLLAYQLTRPALTTEIASYLRWGREGTLVALLRLEAQGKVVRVEETAEGNYVWSCSCFV